MYYIERFNTGRFLVWKCFSQAVTSVGCEKEGFF